MLFIDKPRWEWRGRLWAHLISDESLTELHAAARDLDLRWLLFGRDHYDVPDTLWPAAASVAEVVDSRQIVRRLRASGLRVPGGKPFKAWKPIEALPDGVGDEETRHWLGRVERAFGPVETEVLARPGECVALFLGAAPRDAVRAVIGAAPADLVVVESEAGGRYSVEVVFDTWPSMSTGRVG